MSGSLEQSGNLRSTLSRENESIWREIRKLWAGVNAKTRGVVRDVPFSLGGPLYPAKSARFYLYGGGRLQRVFVSIDVPGTTATTVSILKNGESIGTFSIGAGEDKATRFFDEAMASDTDYIQVEIVSAGDNASGFDAQCRFLQN